MQLGKYSYQHYSAVVKLAPFTINASFVFCVDGNRFQCALCRQCGCRFCLAINEFYIHLQLTKQRLERGGKLETHWLKASTGRVTDSALGSG